MNIFRKNFLFGDTRHIHFVGIGGSGMCGIAEVVFNLGYKVTGSDIAESETTHRLENLGIKIYIGHNSENINGADVVIYSSAVRPDNPEIIEARNKKIPVIPRAEMLAEIMRLKRGIAIAGTHGKTTTTSLIGNILDYAGFNPTIIVGGKLFSIKSNAKLGKGEFLVCEADESDGSFLKLSPEFVVVTNIDNDHLDHYKNFENLKKTFLEFINKIPFYGKAVLCYDDPNITSILPQVYKRFITYGIENKNADFVADKITFNKDGTQFCVYKNGKQIGTIFSRLRGRHNVLNLVGSIALGTSLGIEFKKIKKACENFSGVERRLELIGEYNGIKIYDDYGHHPTEIKATLSSIYKDSGRLIVIFQPHRYTRTKILYKDFKDAFLDADYLFITEIYPAGEKPIKNVTAKLIYNSVKKVQKNVKYIKNKEDAIEEIFKILKKGDIILTLGAGDIKKLAPVILERLKNYGT